MKFHSLASCAAGSPQAAGQEGNQDWKEIQGQHRANLRIHFPKYAQLGQQKVQVPGAEPTAGKAGKSQEGNQRYKRISDPQYMSSTPGTQAPGSGPQTTTAEDNQLQSIGRTVLGVQVTLLQQEPSNPPKSIKN